MRGPIVDLAQHLAWTRTGTVWATWRISPVQYGLRPVKAKRAVKDLHRMLLRSLTGEALALGVTVTVDPVAIVERQISGVDLDSHPAWAAEAEANLDRLADLPLGERVFYLSVPLVNHGRHRWSTPVAAAMSGIRDRLLLPRQHPSADEVAHRLAQAKRIEQVLPAPFKATPVGVAEQLWLAGHAQHRGLVDMPPPADATSQQLLAPTSGAAVPEAILDEGALSDLTDSKRTARINPLARRVLKVHDPRGMELGQGASYQCLMVLADTPPGGLAFPGSEFLGRIDEWGLDVDWALRLRVTAREKVIRANRKALRDLNDQYGQREDETSTGNHDLDLSQALLAAYQETVTNDRLEVEVGHTVLFAVTGQDAEDAQTQAGYLAKSMADYADMRLERPAGAQEELWWAMQPGVPSTRTVRGYEQYTTSDNLAMAVPFTTSTLGGQRGSLFALNTSTARLGVVHLDPGGYPELNVSGSTAICGELGAGKSYACKALAASMVDTGGQLLAIDRSAEGEWAALAGAITDGVVVDPSDLAWSMDPLRALGPDKGALVAQSMLTQLLDISPQEERGITVAQVLSPDYLAEHGLGSMAQVMAHLRGGECDLPHAPELGRHMNNYARLGFGRLVFDDSLPPVPQASPAVVWRTHGMEQPTAAELSQPHLFRSLRPEKIFGRAYYHLLVGAARGWAFADRSRVTVLVCDEAYDIFANPENARDLEVFVREGRRAKAVLLVGSHDPDRDFGSETGRRLIPTRVAMRHQDPDLARAAIRWLGVEEDDPSFVAMVEELRTGTSPVIPDVGTDPARRGEAFMRDAFGGIGRIKVLGPALSARAAAIDSTPPPGARATGGG